MITFPPPFWDAYKRHRDDISAMLDRRCHTIEWVDTQLLSGDMRAFANDEAVILVCIKLYPAGAMELHGMAAAGGLDAIVALIDEAEEWARGMGVDFTCISSRPAWSRILKAKGYDVKRVELVKDLSDGA